MKNTKMKELLQKLGTLMALAILVLIFCITMPDKFMKVGNFMNILKQASINCLIASGMLCALITAGIDLSVGSNCVLCTCTIGVMVQSGITNPFLLVLMGMTTGIGGGMLRDVLIDAMPKVLRKRIYAIASIVGAIGYYLLLHFGVDQTLSTIIITVLITALRILATVFKWNMPQAKL